MCRRISGDANYPCGHDLLINASASGPHPARVVHRVLVSGHGPWSCVVIVGQGGLKPKAKSIWVVCHGTWDGAFLL